MGIADVDSEVHEIAGLYSAFQRHCIIQQFHEVDIFGRKEPKAPAVVGFPEQYCSHFDTPFIEEDDPKTVPRIAKRLPVISEHRNKLCPEHLTHFELSPS